MITFFVILFILSICVTLIGWLATSIELITSTSLFDLCVATLPILVPILAYFYYS